MQTSAEEAASSYELYTALHRSYRRHPDLFTHGRCTAILTNVMGGRPWSWRVIGITHAALLSFHNAGYSKVARDGITRAHIRSRIATTRELLEGERPLSVEEFARVWIDNDKTVLCVRGENRESLPDFIIFPNTDHDMFQSHQVAWRHGREEREFLKLLAIREGIVS